MATNEQLSNLTTGLVSYLKLDGSVNDVVGINNGVATSLTYAEGKVNQAASFNGTSSQIVLSNLLSSGSTFSIQFWIKPSDFINQQRFFYRTHFFFATFAGSSLLHFAFNSGGAIYTNVNLVAGQWFHIVVTYDGSTVLIYHNSGTPSVIGGGVLINAPSMVLGSYDGGDYYSGLIDEVAFWNGKVLTASEVSTLYNNGEGLTFPFQKLITPKRVLRFNNTSLSNGLIAYWKMDGNSYDAIRELSSTDTSIGYVDGKIGRSAEFYGSSHIYFSEINLGTTYTISWWMSPDVWDGEPIGGSVDPNKYATYLYSNLIAHTPDSTLAIASLSAGNAWTNEFKHCVITRNDLEVKLYINGNLTDTKYLANNIALAVARFGRESNSSAYYYIGKLDEVGFWNRNLTTTEILQLYNNSIGNQYPFPRMLSSNLPILSSTLENGISAYWKLDGNASDSLNINNGVETDIEYGDGKINQSAYFNSLTSKVLISGGTGIPTGSANRTISAWVYPLAYSGICVQIGESTGVGGSQDFLFMNYYEPIGGLYYVFSDGFNASNNITVPLSAMSTLNTWNHLVFTLSGQSWFYYKNGVLNANGVFPVSINTNGSKVVIGKREDYYTPLTCYYGYIDEVGIWNKYLNQEDVYKLYNNGLGFQYPFHNILTKGLTAKNNLLLSGLTAYWKFEGNSNDSHGSNHGIDTSVAYVVGKVGQGAYFNGTNSVVSIPYAGINGVGNNLSFSIWVKAVNTNDAVIVFKESIGGNGDYWFNSISGKFGCRVNGGFAAVQATDSYNLDEWYFLTLTWQTNGFGTSLLRFYINGVLQGTDSSNAIITSSNTNLNFGSYILSQYWNGYIDESSLWARIISQDEVLELYNKGRGNTFPFIRPVIETMNGLISYHKLDGNSYDSIGNNDGVDLGASYESGKISLAATFDGSSYIDDIGTTSTYSYMQNTGVFTINFWLKLDDYTVRPQYFMGSSPTTVQKGFYIGMGAGGNFEFTLLNGISSSFVYIIGASGVITDNEWHMYTLVGNGTSCDLYKDSNLITSVLKSSSFATGDSYDTLNFGRINNYGLEYLQGKLDEVGIWDKALTSSEVITLYNNGNGISYNSYGKVLTKKKMLLDNYPGALVGYSLRKLSDKYNGPCVRIRRSSDNAEQDFGFSNDYLDISAFLSFVGSGTGYIKTWYDQSGNGLDVTQTTAAYQPYIQLNVLNSKAVIRFTQVAASSFLSNSNPIIQSEMSGILKESSVFMLYRETGNITFNTPIIFNHPPNSYFSYLHLWAGYSYQAFSERTDAAFSSVQYFANDVTKWSLVSSMYNTHIDGYINGLSVGTTASRLNEQLTISQINIGGGSPSNCLDGHMLECIVYASNKTNLRSQIESNINEYYRIY